MLTHLTSGKRLLVAAGALTLAFTLAAVGVGSGIAYSAAPGGTPGAPGGSDGQGKGGSQALEKFLQREQNVLNSLNHRFDVADRIVTRVQDWIAREKAAGKDTSGLEAGLAAFRAQIAVAKGYRDQAAALLASPAGFDANGSVTDPQLARQTVMAIREDLRNANRALVKAVPDLVHTINQHRKANNEGGQAGGDNQGTEQPEGTEAPKATEAPEGTHAPEPTDTAEPTEAPGG